MASRTDPLACLRCSQRFTQKSSLARHSKRCLKNIKAPSRQKACRQCSASKLRCDLQQPSYGRCQARSAQCEFVSRDSAAASAPIHDSTLGDSTGRISADEHLEWNESASSPTLTRPASSGNDTSEAVSSPPDEPDDEVSRRRHSPDLALHGGIASRLVISEHRRQVLLGNAPGAPSSDIAVRHTMHFVIRVLKSWPRLMAAHDTAQLPPIMHRLQLSDGLPTPLANCYTLVKMWTGHADGSRRLVQGTILQEVRRLLDEHTLCSKADLLATAQSLLMLLIILLFGMGPADTLGHPMDAQLLVGMWDVKHRLAATGLFLEQEADQTIPPWKQWAMASSKRRTITAFHHLEWAWSVLHGYPILTCFELGPLPAPAPRYLWHETDEQTWKRLYGAWLRQWKDGSYKMAEFFEINPGGSLDARSEMWLAEADEFGMMLMAEAQWFDLFCHLPRPPRRPRAPSETIAIAAATPRTPPYHPMLTRRLAPRRLLGLRSLATMAQPSATPVEDLIRERLAPLHPTRLDIFNDSHLHSHHAAMAGRPQSGETHFRLVITADAFRAQRQPARHRMVYALLDDEMKRDGGIHALQLRTMTPEEEAAKEAAQKKTAADAVGCGKDQA